MKCGAMDNSGIVPRKCQELATDSGRCVTHTNGNFRGVGSKNHRDLRYSKALPARLLERYEEAASDPELLSLREEVAIVETRTEEVMSKFDTGESGAIWKKLNKSMLQYKTAENMLRNKNLSEESESNWTNKRDEALESMIQSVEYGVSDYAAWQEVLSLFQQRKVLVEAEQKRLIAMQQMITAESAMTMQVRILNIIKNHVNDPIALAGIASDFAGLSMVRNGAGS